MPSGARPGHHNWVSSTTPHGPAPQRAECDGLGVHSRPPHAGSGALSRGPNPRWARKRPPGRTSRTHQPPQSTTTGHELSVIHLGPAELVSAPRPPPPHQYLSSPAPHQYLSSPAPACRRRPNTPSQHLRGHPGTTTPLTGSVVARGDERRGAESWIAVPENHQSSPRIHDSTTAGCRAGCGHTGLHRRATQSRADRPHIEQEASSGGRGREAWAGAAGGVSRRTPRGLRGRWRRFGW